MKTIPRLVIELVRRLEGARKSVHRFSSVHNMEEKNLLRLSHIAPHQFMQKSCVKQKSSNMILH